MSVQLPPGFRFLDEDQAPAQAAPTLPPGFRFLDEPAPQPADVPLPPRRPDDINALPDNPPPVNPPMPPVRPPEFGATYDDAGQFPTTPAPTETGGALDQVLGNAGKLTPEQGQAEQEAKAAAALKALQDARDNAARTAAAPPQIPSFSDLPPAQESDAQVADQMATNAFTGAANAAAAPPPTLNQARDFLQTFAGESGKAHVDTAKPIGQVNADLGAPQFNQAIAGADKAIGQILPEDPGREDEPAHKIAKVLGGLTPFITGGAIAKGLGLSAKAVNAVIGGLLGGGADYEAAENAGAGALQRYLAMFGGAGIGAAQAVPYLRMLDRVEHMAPGSITDLLKSGAQTTIEQVAVQGLSKLGENGIAKLLYDKDQGLFDGIVESAQVAAIVGGMLGIGGPALATVGARKAFADRLAQSTPEEIDAFLGTAKGKASRADIDEFLRQQAAKEAQSAPALPAPDNRVDENNSANPSPLSPESNTPAEPAPAPVPTVPLSQPGDATLKAMGYGDEEIALMGPGEREEAFEEARQAGIAVPGGAEAPATPAEGTNPPASAEAPESGTRAAPVKVDQGGDIAAAREQVAEPTPAQIEAGNYRKGHVVFDGLPISIENSKGSTRTGTDPDGNEWSATLPADYGYIKGSKGADGDHVDAFIGDKPPNGRAFVIDQHDPKTGKFDEHKVILGVDSAAEGARLYSHAFSDGSGFSRIGGITEVPTADLKTWLAKGEQKAPIAPPIHLPPPPGFTPAVDLKGNAEIRSLMDLAKGDPRRAADLARRMAPAGSELSKYWEKIARQIEQLHGLPNEPARIVDHDLSQKPLLHAPALNEKPEETPQPANDDRRIHAVPREPERGTSPKVEKPKAPQTLLSFIRAAGGIKDVGGNLRAAGLHRYPGLINNKSGMDPDRAREAAAEGGYLGADRDRAHSETTPDDLTDALLNHPTYSSFDHEQLAQFNAKKGATEQREKDYTAALDAIHADQTDNGVPAHHVDDGYLHEAARLHVDEGVPIGDAYERAVMQDALREAGPDKANEANPEIPWDSYESTTETPDTANSEPPGGVVLRNGEERPEREEEERVPADREGPESGGNSQRKPLEEAGAEGKPQLVIAGAEQISQADLAKKKAGENLKPKTPQKDTDGLALFNDSSKQTDLLDQPAKKPEEKPEPKDDRAALLETRLASTPAHKLEDGRGWRIKKEGDGFIALRMGDKIGISGKIPTYFRPEKGETWTADQAVDKALFEAGLEAHNERIRKQREDAQKRNDEALGRKRIGVNDSGDPLFEDERGVRFYVDDQGIRHTETVGINRDGSVDISRLDPSSPDYQNPEFMTPEESEAVNKKHRETDPFDRSVREAIENAYLEIANGKYGEMVGLDKIRAALPNLDRATVDAALKNILASSDERATLQRNDDPRRITPAQKEAAFSPAGEPFHTIAISKPAAQGTEKAGELSPLAQRVLDEMSKTVGQRGYIADLRKAFPDLARAELDRALREIHLNAPDARLMRMDNPRDKRAAESREAAVDFKGEQLHYFWVNEPKGKPLGETIADYDAQIDETIKNIVAAPPAGQKTLSPFDPSKGVPDAVADHLYRGEAFADIRAARKFVKEHGGTDLNQKQIEEAIEHGVVKAARAIVAESKTPAETFDRLVALYANQPNLSTRTSTSVEQQAYSTPAPLAYIASRLARASEGWVLEPTAGNGMLLMEVDPKLQSTTTNELNPDRAAVLKEQGFEPASKDASTLGAFSKEHHKVDVVLANPPFGTVKGENGKSKRFDLANVQLGYNTAEIDHAITMHALDAMKDNGRAVLILGGINKLVKGSEKRSDAYHGKAKREFFHVLYNRYNVTDHFTVAGELYQKQGAGYPIDVIAISGRGKSARKVPSVDVPPILSSWDELKEKLNVAQPAATAPGAEDNLAPGVPAPASEPARPRALDEEHSSDAGRVGPPAEQPADNGPGSVRNGRGGVESGNAGAPGEPSQPPALRPDGERDTRRSGEPPATGGNAGLKPARQEQETEGQSAYRPQSKTGVSLGTLVPKNMRRATEEALATVAKAKGSPDALVASKLGMSQNEIATYFAAEQVDALALALHNLEKGSGFIIGDQTGIGKGRVNAAIIRYAIQNKLTPIFVTEKPNLYADMYRDMIDTGMREYLGREPKILATNSNLSLALDEDGKQVLKTPGAKEHASTLLAAANGLSDHDMVFTTYNQMQTVKGATTPRTAALSALAPKSILILDESHNAGGTEGPVANGTMPRSAFIRGLVSNARGVFYSSATYAKRPGVMDLYSKTDMSKAVEKPEQLASAIASGGVPMQQVVASMLAEAGQYIRRERSFAGVTYEAKTVPVDRKGYNAFSSAIASIQHFSEIIKDAVKNIDKDIKAEAQHITSDGSTGGAGAHSTNFTAIMHNLVNQLLLAQKAEPAVRMAIEALKNGNKPVLTVANTMESFLQEYVEDHDIKPNSPVALGFNDLLHRYLERTRTITIKKPFSSEKGKKHYLTNAELGPAGVKRYKDAQAAIGKADLGSLPISPIDYMRDELARAGFKVAEITGRGSGISYADPKTPRYYIRSGAETSINGRRKAIKAFNGGDADAMVLNQAGATGLSLHASEKVKDQRRRHMILVQPEGNIDTHMQMLGRVHRTGQVITPEYSQLVADIPAEKRPAAVLAKKMASLNASTTAARDGALTADNVTDFMNKYGDEVAFNIMAENPEINRELGEPVDFAAEDQDGAMRKLTGRIPLLPIERQEELYRTLESAYHNLLAEKEAAGENALEAKRLDLDARPVSSAIIKEGAGDSPFTQPVKLEVLDVKRQSKPYFAKDLIADAAKAVEVTPNGDHAKALAEIEAAGRKQNELQVKAAFDAFRPYAKELLGEIEHEATRANTQARIDDNEKRFAHIMHVARVGNQVSVLTDDQRFTGIITKVYRDGEAQNPLALGSWKVKLAIPGKGQVPFPFSKLYTDVKPAGRDDDTLYRLESALPDSNALQNFDEMSKDAREQRVMLTGNLLAAYAHTRGQIVHYTDHTGDVRQGVLLPNTMKSAADVMRGKGVPLKGGQAVLDELNARGPGVPITAANDKEIAVSLGNRGSLIVSVPSSRQRGGKYFLDREVRRAADQDFIRRGGVMRLEVPPSGDKVGVLDALMKAGAKFEKIPEENDQAPVASVGKVKDAPQITPEMEKAVDDALEALGIARRVAGQHADVKPSWNPEATDEAIEASGGRKGDKAFGLFDPKTKNILIRIASGQESRTAHHEGFHALDSADVFGKHERAIMHREILGMRRMVAKAYGLDPERLSRMPNYEIRAYAYAEYAEAKERGDPNAGAGLHIGLRRIFDKVMQFFRRLRNLFGGNGFQTREDIFEGVRKGETADRPAGPRDQRGMTDFDSRLHASVLRPGGNGHYFDRETALERMRRKIGNGISIARSEEGAVDFNAPVRNMQSGFPVAPGQDVYKDKRLLSRKIKFGHAEFQREYEKPLAADLKAHGLTLQDIGAYALAMHAPERNAHMDQVDPNNNGRGSGITDQEAQRILNDLDSQGKLKPLQAIGAKHLPAIREFILNKRVNSGTMSQVQADEYRNMYQHYVDLRGWEDPNVAPDDIQRLGTGKLSVRGPETKHAFGRPQSVSDNPVSNLLDQAYRSIQRAEHNKAGKTLWRWLKSLPKAERDQIATLDKGKMMKVLDDTTGTMRWVEEPGWRNRTDVFAFKIGGKPHYVVFKDPNLAEAMNRLSPVQLGTVTGYIGKFINLEKSLWTHGNPDFVFRHFFMRYPIEGALNAGEHGLGAMLRTFKGYPGGSMFRALRKAEKMSTAERRALAQKFANGTATKAERYQHYYLEMSAAGGKMSFAQIAGIERIKNRLDAALARRDKNPLRASMAVARSAYEAWDHITNALDNAQRLATYVEHRERGDAPSDAAIKASDATVDFAMKGKYANHINLWWPFGNTAAQTANRSVKAAFRSRKYRAVIFGMMGLGAAQALYNYLEGGNDDDGKPFFEKIPDYVRRLNLVAMTPFKDSAGKPYAATISLPYFFAAPFVAGSAAMQLALKGMGIAKEPVGAILKNVLHSSIEAFSPMAQEDSLIGKLTPEPTRALLHAYMNESFSGAPLYTEHPRAGIAHAEQGRRNTNEIWKTIAKGVNTATGGTRYESGKIDLYPEQYKEVLGGPTSAIERLVTHTGNAIDDLSHGRAPNIDDIPVARTVARGDKSYDQADTQDYYEARTHAIGAEQALKKAMAEHDGKEAQRIRKEYAIELDTAKLFHQADGQRGQMTKQVDGWKRDNLPADELKKREEDVHKRDLAAMRRVLKEYERRQSAAH